MRVVSSNDWRSRLPFDTPVVLAELIPGEPARCVMCSFDTEPFPREALWAVKQHHPKHHDGHVRFFCVDHKPERSRQIVPEPLAAPTRAPRAARTPAAERTSIPRRPVQEMEITRAVCPNCFVEVSATGVCGVCGEKP